MAWQTLLSFVALASVGPQSANAATCTEVPLNGPFAPQKLMKCVNGLSIRRSTDPNSCPTGWKIWAPESLEDWQTVIRSGMSLPANPHLIVDVTRPQNGCGNECRKTMNSDNPEVQSWKTNNGEKWWLRSSGYGEPSGDYTANCYLHIQDWSNPNSIKLNDAWCNVHSKDYLCQPAVKVDCTNRTHEITGPCKNENAVFGHSNCTPGVCDQGKYVFFISRTTIDECEKLCTDGRTYQTVASSDDYYFSPSSKSSLFDVGETVERQGATGVYEWTGNVAIETAGNYTFYAVSDDGSKVTIDGTEVVSDGGATGLHERSGAVQLSAGLHAVALSWSGGSGMQLEWKGPDSDGQKEAIPRAAFVQPGRRQYELAGPFKKAGPCVAYSMTSDERCVLWTQCASVGTGKVGDTNLGHLGNLASFKTCQFKGPVQMPSPTAAPSCVESFSGRGADYRGCQTKTRSGKTCQKWESQTPQQHTRTPQNYANSDLQKNFCRNPDNEQTIWCYTTDPSKRWEYCDPVGTASF